MANIGVINSESNIRLVQESKVTPHSPVATEKSTRVANQSPDNIIDVAVELGSGINNHDNDMFSHNHHTALQGYITYGRQGAPEAVATSADSTTIDPQTGAPTTKSEEQQSAADALNQPQRTAADELNERQAQAKKHGADSAESDQTNTAKHSVGERDSRSVSGDSGRSDSGDTSRSVSGETDSRSAAAHTIGLGGQDNSAHNDSNTQGQDEEDSGNISVDIPLDKKSGSDSPKSTSGKELTEEEQQEVKDMKARHEEVKVHEQAHKSAGGSYAAAPSYTYETGPDGKRYITDGKVSIDIATEDDPEDTIAKMQIVKRAALAPAEPSSQDRKVYAEASQKEAEARQELAQQKTEEVQANSQGSSAQGSSASGNSGDNGGTESVASRATRTNISEQNNSATNENNTRARSISNDENDNQTVVNNTGSNSSNNDSTNPNAANATGATPGVDASGTTVPTNNVSDSSASGSNSSNSNSGSSSNTGTSTGSSTGTGSTPSNPNINITETPKPNSSTNNQASLSLSSLSAPITE